MAANAKPGQFLSLYTRDGSKLLPRPISICEIDRENGRIRLVYRVTGKGTGTEAFSRLHRGSGYRDSRTFSEMDFHLKKQKVRKYFLLVEESESRPCWRLQKN